MADTPFGLSRIGQVALRVHDLMQAVAFYRDALGLPLLFQVPNLAFFDCAGLRLMLALPENPGEDHPGSTLYFIVDDIQGAYAMLGARGVTFIDQPHVVAEMPDHDLWMVFFRDPSANLLGLMHEAPRR